MKSNADLKLKIVVYQTLFQHSFNNFQTTITKKNKNWLFTYLWSIELNGFDKSFEKCLLKFKQRNHKTSRLSWNNSIFCVLSWFLDAEKVCYSL